MSEANGDSQGAESQRELRDERGERPDEGEGGDGRRRSRVRFGRDRRERGDRGPREESSQGDAGMADGSQAPSEGPADTNDAEAPRRPRYPTGFATEEGASHDAPGRERGEREPQAAAPALAPARVTAPAPAAPAPAPAAPALAPASAPSRAAAAPAADTPPARPGLPKVQSFTLSVTDLEQLATGSGLQWVNSDADKVAAVQAAIAAEPKPVHVPRERPPVVVVDEGPLVLVETRKDLGQVTLPFEAEAQR